jgi:hypothetical protein
MLPKWQDSNGAIVEFEYAEKLGKKIIDLSDVGDLSKPGFIKAIDVILGGTDKTILVEADSIVNGSRRNSYGTPLDNHTRTAELWSTYTGKKISPEDVCYLNILQKIARTIEHDKRDNAVDICGYARNVELIKQAKSESW